MAYVAPKSWIYLIKGCPCDRSYNNTLYFEDKREQWVYMRSLATHTFTDQYYQRYERGYLRIQANAEDLYEVNYMAFSNDRTFNPSGTPTDNQKIFYCFIDNIEYINENVTEIHYTIDVMQTYMFDYKLGQCFVEREHTLTDGLYENLIEEDFVPYNYTEKVLLNKKFDNWCIAIEYAVNITDDPNVNTHIVAWQIGQYNAMQLIEGRTYSWSFRNNAANGVLTIYIPIKSQYASSMLNWLSTIVHKLTELSATITNVYYIPYDLVNQPWCFDSQTHVRKSFEDIDMTVPHSAVIDEDTISLAINDGPFSVAIPDYFYGARTDEVAYLPENNKLYMYPYQYVKITNSQGDSEELLYENFEEGSKFKLLACAFPTPEITLVPYKYNTQEINVEKRISINDFPSSVWNEDSALRYRTENRNKINMALLGSALTIAAGIGLSVATENPLPAISAIGTSAATTVPLLINNNPSSTNATMANIIDARNAARNIQSPNTTLTANPNMKMIGGGTASLAYTIGSLLDLEKKQDVSKGSQAYSTLMYFLNSFGFKVIYKCIKPYEAKRIDHFFTMFGYAIRDVKVPNILNEPKANLRPHWNYIKNGHTVIIPNEYVVGYKRYVNNDVEEELQSIYNKGITFWMHGEEVGDYSLDNSPQI